MACLRYEGGNLTKGYIAISLAGTIILCLPADCLFKTFRMPGFIGMLAVGAGFTAPLDGWAMDWAGPP
jgi:hypothetical protein